MEKLILEVDGTNAQRTIKDIRAELKEAKSAFETAAIGSEEFEAATKKVAAVQGELKAALQASSLSLEEAQKEVVTAGKSYSQLSAEMSELKKVWKETTDETARIKIGENINALNAKLKELDATTGNFQRNVGNYASAFSGFEAALTDIGQKITDNGKAFLNFGTSAKTGLGGIASGFKAVGKALIANPLGVIITLIGLLIPLFQKLADKISLGREVMERLNVVGSLLEAPLNLISTAVEKLVSTLVSGVEMLVKFADKLGLLPQAAKDAMNASKALAEAENEQRIAAQNLAIVTAEMAERRALAKDETLSLEEREKHLTAAHNAEIEALRAEAKAAADMYAAMQKQAELSPTSAADEEKLANARIKAANAQKAVNDSVRQYNTEITELHRKKIAEETAALNERNKKHAAYLAMLKQDAADRKALLSLQIDNETQWTETYMRLSAERIEIERKEAIEKANTIRVAEVRNATLLEIEKKYNAQQKTLIDARNEYRKAAEETAIQLQAEANRTIAELEEAELAEAWEKVNQSLAVATADAVNVWDIWLDPEKAQADIDANAEKVTQLKLQIEEFQTWQYESEAAAEAAREELIDQYTAAQIKASNDVAKQDAVNAAKRLQAAKTTFSGMVSALQSWSKESEAAKRAYKATATAETVMNTAEGAMGAYKAMAGIPYVGPALGVAAAAAVVAEGAAQIKNINAADSGSVSSGSSGGGASSSSVSAPSPAVLSETESAFIESRTEQKDQRVVIVASDIVKSYDDYKAVEMQNSN